MRRSVLRDSPIFWESIKIMKMIGEDRNEIISNRDGEPFPMYFEGSYFYHKPHISWQAIYERWRKVRRMIFKQNGYRSKKKCYEDYEIDDRVYVINNMQDLCYMIHHFSDRFSNSRGMCFGLALKKIRCMYEG